MKKIIVLLLAVSVLIFAFESVAKNNGPEVKKDLSHKVFTKKKKLHRIHR